MLGFRILVLALYPLYDGIVPNKLERPRRLIDLRTPLRLLFRVEIRFSILFSEFSSRKGNTTPSSIDTDRKECMYGHKKHRF